MSKPDMPELDAQYEQGGPAFPLVHEGGGGTNIYYGMSLRDWFAGQCLSGLVGRGYPIVDPKDVLETAGYAYQVADAMLKVRKEE